MMGRPIITTLAAFLVVFFLPVTALNYIDDDSPTSARRLEIAVTNSDEYAESVLTVQAAKYPLGIGESEYTRISSILDTTRQMIDLAKVLVQNELTLQEGKEMMERANGLFRDVKDYIMKQRNAAQDKQAASDTDEDGVVRGLIRKKYSDHDINKAEEDEKRALDISRKIYETMVTFPECVGELMEVCLEIINDEIANLGLATIEVVVREKRNQNQDGYNKVVIITNELCDLVKGRAGNGIITYPYLWYDSEFGMRTVGVDGKWNCHDYTPEDCCAMIKQSVPNKDTNDNHLECHIFVPFGGVGNPRRNDRVFITLSPDGRVHEPPIIQ